MLATKTGKVLYCDEAANLAYRQFLHRIAERLMQLELLNFDDTEWANFTTVMQQDDSKHC